jgi:hypothetical protein
MKRKAKRRPAQRKHQDAGESEPVDAIDRLVRAAAATLDLPLDPTWHAGVAFNLHLIMRHASLIDEFALPDESEPAPVFHA